MKKLILILSLILLSSTAFCQNKTDKKGLKQGKWIEYFDNEKVRLQGQFTDGFPVGEFIYFDENGLKKAKNIFSSNGQQSECEMYDENGNVVAKGLFVNKKKHGVWYYFNTAGEKMLTETYKYGVLDGPYTLYYEHEMPRFFGVYKDGVMVGKWTTYDPEGNVISEEEHQDLPMNE